MRRSSDFLDNTHQRHSGFTLIELMVVMAVVGVLAAIIFPTFTAARERARMANCASNMRQLGMAFTQYAQDHNDRFPGAWDGGFGAGKEGGWIYYSQFGMPTEWKTADDSQKASFDVTRGVLYPYVKSAEVYICPSDGYGPKLGPTGLSYAANACISRQKRDATGNRDLNVFQPGKKINIIKNPSNFMLLAEEAQPGSAGNNEILDNSSTDDGYYNLPRKVPAESSHTNYLALRHSEGGNVAFVDGHVKWYKREEVLKQKLQIGDIKLDLDKGCPEFQGIELTNTPPTV
jgi:prepilin-type N-terminal cleavage/methylation domain-containing protein/prepilin-type processing-associated H-X9-DG protein